MFGCFDVSADAKLHTFEAPSVQLQLKCSSGLPSQDVKLAVTLALRAGLFLKDGEVNGRVSQRKWFPNNKSQMKKISELRDGFDLCWGHQSQEESKDTILFFFIFEKKKKGLRL